MRRTATRRSSGVSSLDMQARMRSRRSAWVMAMPGLKRRRARWSLGRWPLAVAQFQNATIAWRWDTLALSHQVSRSGWVIAAGVMSLDASQARNRAAAPNLRRALWKAVAAKGFRAAAARMAASWSQRANWVSSRIWGWLAL